MDALPVYFNGIFAVLLLSAFVKIFTALTILRYGVGLETPSFGIVVFAVSLALSLVVMEPQLAKVGGLNRVLGGAAPLSAGELDTAFRPFLEKNVDSSILDRLQRMRGTSPAPAGEATAATKQSFPLLAAAFLLGELRTAFNIGFLILIPFLVIDLLIANILVALGITQISQAVVALPFKILLFFAVNGWTVLGEKLIAGYS